MNKIKLANSYSDFEYVLIYYSFLQLCYGFYDGIDRNVPGGIGLFGLLLLFWLVAKWIINDTKKTNITWISDSRFALFVAWPLLVPIYLFQTRKLKAFKEITCFFAFAIFFYLIGLIVGGLIIS
jgi:hypothetical protein